MRFFKKILVTLMVSMIFLNMTPMAEVAFSKSSSKGKESNSSRAVTINFNDVDITVFIKFISELTGKNFVVDNSVRGKVTVVSPSPISVDEAYRVFESVLELNGFTAVPDGAVINILPSDLATVKSKVVVDDYSLKKSQEQVVTKIIKLQHVDPLVVKKNITPLVSKTSSIIAYADSGILIVTDLVSNIERIMEIVKVIDVPSIGEELEVIPLQYASATSVSKSLAMVFQKTARKGVRPANVKITPYERSNSLIVLAPRAQMQKIKDLAAKLDTPIPKIDGNIHVFYLQNANAEELVKVLTKLPEKTKVKNKKGGTPTAPSISDDVRIMADEETNSIIVVGPKDDYLALEDVIKKLDIPRRMVYLEVLIMEVSASKNFELGVEWGGIGKNMDGSGETVAVGFSNQGNTPYSDMMGVLAENPVMPSGLSFGLMKKGIKVGNMLFPNIDAVVKAYQKDNDVNIVSTPQILTMNNKKASIVVGETVPYLVSSYKDNTNNDDNNSQEYYKNYEYKDVATTLEITPQVNNADVLRLDIMAELVKLKAVSPDGEKPTTFKRRAETTVVLHDNETVVIGGIVGQQDSVGDNKVPLLGDIPLLGWMFKTETQKEDKKNLYIFITPRIVENPAELSSLYNKKKDSLREVFPKSADVLEETFEYDPDEKFVGALIDKGVVKMKSGDNKAARQYFTEALQYNPDDVYAMFNLATVYERDGQKEIAMKIYKKIMGTPSYDGTGSDNGTNSIKEMAREALRKMGEFGY